jgi:hypothetical protein
VLEEPAALVAEQHGLEPEPELEPVPAPGRDFEVERYRRLALVSHLSLAEPTNVQGCPSLQIWHEIMTIWAESLRS